MRQSTSKRYDYTTGVNIPTKGVLPTPYGTDNTSSTNLAGTITTNGQLVTGVGTNFVHDFPAGSFLYDPTNYQLVKVQQVYDNNRMSIDLSLTTPLTGAIYQAVQRKFVEMICSSEGTSAAILNGQSFKSNKIESLNLYDNALNPVLYDASASNALIVFTCLT